MQQWKCENPLCNAVYAEYVNGCPKCNLCNPGHTHSYAVVLVTPPIATSPNIDLGKSFDKLKESL